MLFGEIGETLELFMMIGAVLFCIWLLVVIQNKTGTGYE
jgi:hypothetical protein